MCFSVKSGEKYLNVLCVSVPTVIRSTWMCCVYLLSRVMRNSWMCCVFQCQQ